MEADEIKSEDNFKSDLGLGSFDTMCLVNDLKSEYGIELQAKDFVDYKTVGKMAEYIAGIK